MMEPQTDTLSSSDSPSGHMLYVWMVALVASMGGLLFGYDYVVIGGAKPFLEKYFQLDSASSAVGPTVAPCWAAWRGR